VAPTSSEDFIVIQGTHTRDRKSPSQALRVAPMQSTLDWLVPLLGLAGSFARLSSALEVS